MREVVDFENSHNKASSFTERNSSEFISFSVKPVDLVCQTDLLLGIRILKPPHPFKQVSLVC